MRAFKRIAGALGVLFLGVAFAAFATYLTAPEEDRPDVVELTESLDADGEQERMIDWGSLPSEVIAWVEVPGTPIDEPIVQATPDAPNAYLYMDALGQGAYGTPYIDCECSLDSPFVVVYGHNMSDGSAFADFANYIDESYAREHGEIILYQRDGETLRLEPVAVDVVDASRERLVIGQLDNLDGTMRKADLRLNEISAASRLFAFATCSYQTSNSRTVVYASIPQSTS